MARTAVVDARRVVVKVGSSSLTNTSGQIDSAAVEGLADVIAAARTSGREVVLVSSGAIAAGFAPLGRTGRPRDLATQQAAASVGQGLLMHRYTEAFAARGIVVGQISDQHTRIQEDALVHRSLLPLTTTVSFQDVGYF